MKQKDNLQELNFHIDNFKKGNEESLKYIFNYFDVPLRGMAKKYYIDGEDSDDIMQIAKIGLFKGLQTYDKEKSVDVVYFLKNCAESDIKDELQKMKRDKRKILNYLCSIEEPVIDEKDNPILISDIIASNFSVHEIVEKKERKKYIQKHIYSMMSDLELDVLKLYADGYSYSEIAKTLSMSIKKIDNALQRIRKKIRQSKKFEEIL